MLVLCQYHHVSAWGKLSILANIIFISHLCFLHSWGWKYYLCVVGLVLFLLTPLQPYWNSWVPYLVNIAQYNSVISVRVRICPLQGAYLVLLASGFISTVQLAIWAGDDAHSLQGYISLIFSRVIIFILFVLVFMWCVFHSWGLDTHYRTPNPHSYVAEIHSSDFQV